MLGAGSVSVEFGDLQAVWLDLKAHVERLAGERAQYLELFEAAPDAYVLTDPHGHVIEANGAAVDILQRRKHYLRGKPLSVWIAPERRPGFRSRLNALVARRESAERSWRTAIVAGAEPLEIKVTVRPIVRDERVTGVCWLLQPAQ